jgi:hypothetical protein
MELPRDLTLAGWKERVDLPALGLSALPAKLDTGARTSALHVASATAAPPRDGLPQLRVTLARYRSKVLIEKILPLLDEVAVTTSGGHRELRPVIATELLLGPLARVIRLTLTDRSALRSPMILGRSAFAGVLLVDASRTYLLAPRRAASRRRRTSPPRDAADLSRAT